MKNSLYLTVVGLIYILFLSSCSEPTNRKNISLNGDWSFAVDSLSIGDTENWGEKGVPQSSSVKVTVPHVWNVEKGLEEYWGDSWYERKFEISNSDINKTFRIQFDAIYHSCIVYVNGQKAGEHIGSGYNRFFINITPFIKAGENTLTVKVNNDFSRNNIPFLKSYDWANDGGIYRDVSLVITDPQAIKNIHVVGTPNGNKGTANINVSFIDNSKIETSEVKLLATITEENQSTNNKIFESELEGEFKNGKFLTSLNFESINPWHFDSPNLYKLSIKLNIDGEQKDEFSAIFGFRSIKVENNRYILNGEPIRLMGVEWMPGSNLERGMAETTADFDTNLTLMKNANCIYTRFHWQQDDYIFDWCDRNGILVQEEIPYWGGATKLNDTLFALGVKHLTEMTENHYNHPSIITWGIGNELYSSDPTNIKYLKKLYNIAKDIDSSRLVNYVTNKIQKGKPEEAGYIPDVSAEFDMIMFNEYYSTWFYKSIDILSDELDRISAEYPNKPITIAEWGLCEPVHKGGDPRRIREMKQQLEIYGSKEYIAGAIYFCLNDYRTHYGEDFTYSYPQRVHGVCDIHLTPKPSYKTLKIESSPLVIKSVDVKENEIIITLLGKTTIPSYTIRNYTIVSGNEKVLIDKLKPGEEKTFRISSEADEFVILRPTGFEVIKHKFK